VNHRFRKNEHDLAISVNEFVGIYLSGSHIEMRNIDPGRLESKVKQINLIKADLAVETHFNSSENPHASGFEVLYYPGSEDGKILAQCLLQSFHEYLPFRNRGVKERADLLFLSSTGCPAVIIEPFFISNDSEMMFLENYPRGKEVLALAVSQGIRAYTVIKKEAA